VCVCVFVRSCCTVSFVCLARTHTHNYTSYLNRKIYLVPYTSFFYSVSSTNVMGFSEGDAHCHCCVQYELYRAQTHTHTHTHTHQAHTHQTHTHTHTHCSFLLRTVPLRLLLGVLYEVKLECLIWRPGPYVRLSPSVSGFIWNSSWVFFTTICWMSCVSYQSAQKEQNFFTNVEKIALWPII
jgi:hypothetical protein